MGHRLVLRGRPAIREAVSRPRPRRTSGYTVMSDFRETGSVGRVRLES